MGDRILIRPRTDGTLEYSRCSEELSTAFDPSGLTWAALYDEDGQLDLEYSADDHGCVLIPGELTLRRSTLPVHTLRKGGRKWLRLIQRLLPRLKLAWSIDCFFPEVRSPLPIPFLITPVMPSWSLFVGLMLLAAVGWGLSSVLAHTKIQLQSRLSGYERRIEQVRSELDHRNLLDDSPTTAIGSLDQIRALEGWASWVCVHVLSEGVRTGQVMRMEAAWHQPLDMGNPHLPREFRWSLYVQNLTNGSLRDLVQALEENGLGPVRIEHDDDPVRFSAGPGEIMQIGGTVSLTSGSDR